MPKWWHGISVHSFQKLPKAKLYYQLVKTYVNLPVSVIFPVILPNDNSIKGTTFILFKMSGKYIYLSFQSPRRWLRKLFFYKKKTSIFFKSKLKTFVKQSSEKFLVYCIFSLVWGLHVNRLSRQSQRQRTLSTVSTEVWFKKMGDRIFRLRVNTVYFVSPFDKPVL